MIRINLAKGKGKIAAAADATQTRTFASGGSDEPNVRRALITRVALLLLGPVILFVYEQQTLPAMSAQLRQKNTELNTLTQKNNQAREAVSQTKKYKAEQEALQTQISTIENLKKDRLREVKVLDFMQKDMPTKLWLTRMELSEGKLDIQGISSTDAELTLFMDNLSRSAYLKEVSLVRSVDYSQKEYGAVKKFEISCLMEKVQ